MKESRTAIRVESEQTTGSAATLLRSDDASFVRLKEVLHLLQVSRSTLWRMIRANQFIRPYRLTPSGSVMAFRRDEVIEWIRQRERS